MAVGLKEKKLGTIILVVLVGILIGSYLNTLIRALIPGDNNVVKNVFTTNISFGIGDFDEQSIVVLNAETPDGKTHAKNFKPLLINLYAIQFLLGFQIRLSLMSVIGIFLSLYFFRWYR